MFDLNNAEKQSDFAGVIPKNSMVKLRLEIKPPTENKKSNFHPAMTIPKNGGENHYLEIVFHVVSGTYEKNKIYSNMVCVGSEQATKISMKMIRAIVEGARGINQDDISEQANMARDIQGNPWNLDNMEFAAKIGYEKIDSGSKYVNNKIQTVLRPGVDVEYQQIMNGGEIITTESIPEIPKPKTGGGNGGGPGNGPGSNGPGPGNQTQGGGPGNGPGNGPGSNGPGQTYNPQGNQSQGNNQNQNQGNQGGGQTYNPPGNQNQNQGNPGNQTQGGGGGQPNWSEG